MKLNLFPPVLGAASLIAACPSALAETSKPGPPNIVMFLVDDVGGINDLQSSGNPYSRTPYLDRLHSESLRLTNFHVAPMCTPTRGALLTGRDAADNQATMVTCGKSVPRPELPMLQEVLRDAGYATGLFGKWHLGENKPFRPSDRGFEESLYFPGSSLGTARDYWNNGGWDATVLHNDVRKKYPGFITDVWNDEAIQWMKTQKEAGRPFFCFLPSNLVHGPEFVEEEYKERFRERGNDETISRIYGALERYDGICARVDDFLAKEGLRDNTIVIYFVDNGLCKETAEVFNAGLRGHKRTYYEGGHRVPFFIRWPHRGWTGGKDFGQLTDVQDVFPTLLDACGITPPKNLELTGESLVPLFDGKPMPELDDRILVVTYGEWVPTNNADGVLEGGRTGPEFGKAAVMWREWRLVNDKELYNLETDLGQTKNLIESELEIAEKLRTAYRNWWNKIRPDEREMVHIPIGLDDEPVLLDISSWDGVWVDHSNVILQAIRANGPWVVEIAEEGEYRFDLRRWPEQLGLPMTSPAPAGDWPYVPGEAMPIAKVRLEIQGQTVEHAVTEEDHVIPVTLKLEKGKTRLNTAFLDDKGKVLSGIYYVDVTRVK